MHKAWDEFRELSEMQLRVFKVEWTSPHRQAVLRLMCVCVCINVNENSLQRTMFWHRPKWLMSCAQAACGVGCTAGVIADVCLIAVLWPAEVPKAHGRGDLAALPDHSGARGGVLFGLHVDLHPGVQHGAGHVQRKHVVKTPHHGLQAQPLHLPVSGGGELTRHLRTFGLLRLRLEKRLGANLSGQRQQRQELLREEDRQETEQTDRQRNG